MISTKSYIHIFSLEIYTIYVQIVDVTLTSKRIYLSIAKIFHIAFLIDFSFFIRIFFFCCAECFCFYQCFYIYIYLFAFIHGTGFDSHEMQSHKCAHISYYVLILLTWICFIFCHFFFFFLLFFATLTRYLFRVVICIIVAESLYSG